MSNPETINSEANSEKFSLIDRARNLGGSILDSLGFVKPHEMPEPFEFVRIHDDGWAEMKSGDRHIKVPVGSIYPDRPMPAASTEAEKSDRVRFAKRYYRQPVVYKFRVKKSL